jgi:hypothetical protein
VFFQWSTSNWPEQFRSKKIKNHAAMKEGCDPELLIGQIFLIIFWSQIEFRVDQNRTQFWSKSNTGSIKIELSFDQNQTHIPFQIKLRFDHK